MYFCKNKEMMIQNYNYKKSVKSKPDFVLLNKLRRLDRVKCLLEQIHIENKSKVSVEDPKARELKHIITEIGDLLKDIKESLSSFDFIFDPTLNRINRLNLMQSLCFAIDQNKIIIRKIESVKVHENTKPSSENLLSSHFFDRKLTLLINEIDEAVDEGKSL